MHDWAAYFPLAKILADEVVESDLPPDKRQAAPQPLVGPVLVVSSVPETSDSKHRKNNDFLIVLQGRSLKYLYSELWRMQGNDSTQNNTYVGRPVTECAYGI